MKLWRAIPLILLLLAMPAIGACSATSTPEYNQHLGFSTTETQMLVSELAEGEILEGHFESSDELTFYTVDYWGRTVLDAGRVRSFDFKLEAEYSTVYSLYFYSPPELECIVNLDYNSPLPLIDLDKAPTLPEKEVHAPPPVKINPVYAEEDVLRIVEERLLGFIVDAFLEKPREILEVELFIDEYDASLQEWTGSCFLQVEGYNVPVRADWSFSEESGEVTLWGNFRDGEYHIPAPEKQP